MGCTSRDGLWQEHGQPSEQLRFACVNLAVAGIASSDSAEVRERSSGPCERSEQVSEKERVLATTTY